MQARYSLELYILLTEAVNLELMTDLNKDAFFLDKKKLTQTGSDKT